MRRKDEGLTPPSKHKAKEGNLNDVQRLVTVIVEAQSLLLLSLPLLRQPALFVQHQGSQLLIRQEASGIGGERPQQAGHNAAEKSRNAAISVQFLGAINDAVVPALCGVKGVTLRKRTMMKEEPVMLKCFHL